MKKITLLITLFLISSVMLAQNARQAAPQHKKLKSRTSALQSVRTGNHGATAMRVAHSNSVQSITPFYSEDFSGGSIPATWTNDDLAGSGEYWKWTDVGANDGDALNPTGTSAANGYVIFDSDSAGQVGVDGVLTSPLIDCSAHANVHLRLNEYFLQYLSSLGLISVSNDNNNWTVVHDAETGLAQYQSTPNPNLVDLDISSIAGGQDTVYIRFEYIGNYDFYWMIDDIQLFEPIASDAAVNSVTVNLFNACTLSSTEPVSALIKNNGTAAISNFPVSFTVDGGSPVTETYTGTLNPGDTATYTFAGTADLSAPGIRVIQVYTALTGDLNNDNDTVTTEAFSVAHIDPSLAPYTMGFEAGDDISAWTVEDVDGDGTTFDISPDNPHSGLLSAEKPTGGLVADDNWLFTQCMDVVPGGTYTLSYWYKSYDNAFPCDMEVYMGAANDAADMTEFITASLYPGDSLYHQAVATISVAPGTYYMGFHCFTSNPMGTDPFYIDDINISFLPDGIKENTVSSAISIYPNPSDGKITISNGSKMEKNFLVNVYNSVGQVVFTAQYENLVNEQIDLSKQPAGIYSVQLKSDNNSMNKSVVISGR